MELITDLLKKYKSVILYLVFGVLSTILNIATYALCSKIFKINYFISNTIAWIIAVIFAYLTNRIYVFESDAKTKKNVFKEIVLFFYYRIVTLILEFAILYIGINLLKIDDLIIKVISNIVVILLNYIFSKFKIFKKKSPDIKNV